MKRVFMLMMIVVAVVGINAAVVSAAGESTSTPSAVSSSIVPLSHGVDH
jgi:hypothetical protein